MQRMGNASVTSQRASSTGLMYGSLGSRWRKCGGEAVAALRFKLHPLLELVRLHPPELGHHGLTLWWWASVHSRRC